MQDSRASIPVSAHDRNITAADLPLSGRALHHQHVHDAGGLAPFAGGAVLLRLHVGTNLPPYFLHASPALAAYSAHWLGWITVARAMTYRLGMASSLKSIFWVAAAQFFGAIWSRVAASAIR